MDIRDLYTRLPKDLRYHIVDEFIKENDKYDTVIQELEGYIDEYHVSNNDIEGPYYIFDCNKDSRYKFNIKKFPYFNRWFFLKYHFETRDNIYLPHYMTSIGTANDPNYYQTSEYDIITYLSEEV